MLEGWDPGRPPPPPPTARWYCVHPPLPSAAVPCRRLWRPGQQEDLPRPAVSVLQWVSAGATPNGLPHDAHPSRKRFHLSPTSRPRPSLPPACLPLCLRTTTRTHATACSFLPRNVSIIGYSRTAMTSQQLRDKLRPRLDGNDLEVGAFLQRCTYVAGAYDGAAGWQALAAALAEREAEHPGCPYGRLYYLALPPSVYPQVCAGLKVSARGGMASQGEGRCGKAQQALAGGRAAAQHLDLAPASPTCATTDTTTACCHHHRRRTATGSGPAPAPGSA